MKVKYLKFLTYLIDFLTVNGFYVIIAIFVALNPALESRYYTIPVRIIAAGSMVLLIILKRFKPCRNPVVYMFFLWFFIFYWFKIILEMVNGNQSMHIPPYEYLLYSFIYCFLPFLYYSQRNTRISYEQIFKAILISGIIFSIIVIFLFFKTSLELGKFDRNLIGINPLIISYVGSLIIGLCFSRLIYNRSYGESKLLLIGILFGICPFLIGGSRGPVLSLVLPLFFAFMYKTKIKIRLSSIKYIIFFILVLSVALMIFGDIAFERLSNVLKHLPSKNQDASRLLIWETAIGQFLSSPLWGDSIQLGKGFEYPHNLSLEVLMSTGIIGYIPFLTLMCFGIYRSLLILKSHPSYIWLYVFFLQAIIMGMLSGNVYSDIWYWSSLALILSVDLNKENNDVVLQTSYLNAE